MNPSPKTLVMSSKIHRKRAKAENEGEERGEGRVDDQTEKVFRLDAAFVKSQKRNYSKEIWEDKGEVKLPFKESFTKIIVDVEEELAKEIKQLNLNRNPVVTVKDAEKLSEVSWLVGQQCNLDFVPKWFEKLHSLETVDFRFNDIPEIPHWLLKMEHLKWLYLDNNAALQSIPTPEESLIRLNMSGCDIQKLPHNFFNSQLTFVDLSGNRGQSIVKI